MNDPAPPSPVEEPFMTRKDVAAYFRISTRTVARAVSTGQLPGPIKIGKRSPRWSRAAIVEHVAGLTKTGGRRS